MSALTCCDKQFRKPIGCFYDALRRREDIKELLWSDSLNHSAPSSQFVIPSEVEESLIALQCREMSRLR